ncbi:MAG: indolepyruvate oxidoreductase subunit beta [Christensenellaceae bacterium]|jgi:indolepyruvate ferredoxin oxidoreductase beta subunit|nr:indolepyruvate oxidoreductase subunit beta [Christensenellaceae bacterium]
MNVLIVGVGGQGALLISKILGETAKTAGLDCKVSEVHGMSQRGGSVVTFVRTGTEVFSPTIPIGQADYILSFEKIEALRYKHYLKKGGVIVTSSQEILPMPVITGAEKYPEDAAERLLKDGVTVKFIDAVPLALSVGNAKAANVVMLGALAKIAKLDISALENALAICVKPKFLEANTSALLLGYNA